MFWLIKKKKCVSLYASELPSEQLVLSERPSPHLHLFICTVHRILFSF